MIIPREMAESVNNVKLPMEIFEILHNISLYLIEDDRADLGRFAYSDRVDHWYHGKNNIHHPGVMHHWILGLFGMLTAQVGSLALKGYEMYKDYKRIESGDYRDIDKSIMDLVEDNNTMPLEEYKNEVMAIAPVSATKAEKRIPKIPEISSLPGF